jgi:hypothetical protein
MGPLELLYSWQALLVAVAATGVTQLVKTILDVAWGHVDTTPTPTMKDAKVVGAELRRRSIILNRFVMPMTPILTGAVMAMVVPIRPDQLLEYITTHHIAGTGAMLVYASWGAACGQFADYGFSKVKAALGDVRTKRASSTPPPPADGAG